MAIQASTFDSFIPSRYISFTIPFQSEYFITKQIQISVLDSPQESICSPSKVAAMLIPKNRENDWIFTTEAGHFQLLLSSPGISRLILIGNIPDFNVKTYRNSIEKDPIYVEKVKESLCSLLMVLSPKEVAQKGICEVPFLSYEDNVVSSVVLEKCIGPFVGEMLVEDVEIEGRFRRRLRFKKTPNLVQTEILVTASGIPDLGVLVHPYLAPMVAGLSLIGGYLQEKFESGVNPRVCCVGVGGGALLSFLSNQLSFEVIGVEIDEVVLKVAMKYFGLQTGKGVQIRVGNGIDILNKKACQLSKNIRNDSIVNDIDAFETKFDVIMVDLDSNDSKMGISAPSVEFVETNVFRDVKLCLSESGILVLNVIIPPNGSFYDTLIRGLKELFVQLHEMDCGNEENFVLVASMSNNYVLHQGTCENAFSRKLKSVIPEIFINCIKKI